MIVDLQSGTKITPVFTDEFSRRWPITAGSPPRSPSFLIPGASTSGSAASGRGPGGSGSVHPPDLRLDRINSRQLIRSARTIYYRFLEACPASPEPAGVVIAKNARHGRVVFDRPVLLLEEHFVPIEWLLQRDPRSRSGRSVSTGGRQQGVRPSGSSR